MHWTEKYAYRHGLVNLDDETLRYLWQFASNDETRAQTFSKAYQICDHPVVVKFRVEQYALESEARDARRALADEIARRGVPPETRTLPPQEPRA